MKAKKVTYKELANRIDIMLQRVMQISNAMDYTHTLLVKYIEMNKDIDKLKEFLKKEEEDAQAKRSDTEGDREDKSGNTDTNTKSKQSRKKVTK